MREEKIKGRLVDGLHLAPGQRVLDLGCGTATLTLMIKAACPGASVFGIDGDPDVLRIGREKAKQRGLDVTLTEAMAYAPPFQPGSFERVVSSLVFHHLSSEDKRRTLASVFALLRPSGELHIADFTRSGNPIVRAAMLGFGLFDGLANTRDNLKGRLPLLIEEAGFREVAETHRESTLFGPLAFYRGVRP
jgi:ubiquinone/menaquinone biosynthesis C-methylase UbiE